MRQLTLARGFAVLGVLVGGIGGFNVLLGGASDLNTLGWGREGQMPALVVNDLTSLGDSEVMEGPELALESSSETAGAKPREEGSGTPPPRDSSEQENGANSNVGETKNPQTGVALPRKEGSQGEAAGQGMPETSRDPAKPLASGEKKNGRQDSGSSQSVNPAAVGHPLAPGIVKLVAPEITSQMQTSGAGSRFQQFLGYVASRLQATRGLYTGSEINGLARLSWFDRLLREPLRIPEEAEEFTRYLHAGAVSERAEGFRFLLRTARARMDVPPSGLTAEKTDAESLARFQDILVEAYNHYARSVKPLSEAELSELARRLNYVMTTNTYVGHTVNDRGSAIRLVRLLEKMDRAAQWDMAEVLAGINDRVFLEELRDALKAPESANAGGTVPGVTGQVLRRIETPVGTIVVGGPGANEYQLEAMQGVVAIADLGGDDVYLEGTVTVSRPVLVIIDYSGNDRYEGKLPGIQGSSLLGGAILIDLAGNDVYWAQDLAQGSTLGGVGILVDWGGNDRYLGRRRVQGQAIGGVGILIDREGTDDYHAAMWAQGFGGPLGFGLIDDRSGDDHYYVGGQWYDSYPETPGYEGWGQGVGSGIRGVANGGIGVLLEGAGDDEYEFDYFGEGGGYWLAIGFARDFAGNDRRLGATLKAYNGSPRTQQRFQRFGNGWGCHMGVGALIDDGGDDEYHGSIMGTGFGWDLSVGYLLELTGKDRYLASVGGVQGQGAQASLGVLYDFEGKDEYKGTSQGYSSSAITYHPYLSCGGNFSFVIDYGGLDSYGSGAKNNAITRRGSGGFIVDRPKQEELEAAQREVFVTPTGLPDTASQ